MFVFFSVPWFMNGVGRLLDGAFASIAAISVKPNILSAAARLFTYSMVRCPRGPTANVRDSNPCFVHLAGRPRTGDTAYVDHVEVIVGRGNMFCRLSCIQRTGTLLTWAPGSKNDLPDIRLS